MERNYSTDREKGFLGWKEIISLTERTDFTDRKGGFHCEIGKLLAYEIKVLISLTGTMLLEYGF